MSNDLRFVVRQWVKNPGFTAAALLTFALGIGASTAVFTLVDRILLQPLPWPDSHRVLSVWEGSPAKGFAKAPVAPAQFLDLHRESKAFVALAGWNVSAVNLASEGGPPERYPGAAVTRDFFRVVGVAPVRGAGFSDDQFEEGADGVVLLGHGIWQERFGGATDIVGRTIRINGRSRTVTGVMPPGFRTPAQAQFWVPRVFSPMERGDRDFKSLMVLGRLADGVTSEQALTESRNLFAGLRRQFPDVLTGWDVSVHPALEDIAGPLRPPLLTLLAAVATVLVLACLNMANLSLARGLRRHGELSVRAALGADRRVLLRQLMSESLVLAGFGGILGLLLAQGILAGLLALAPANLPRLDQVRMDVTTFAFAAGAIMVTGLVFGLVPAWRLSRACPLDALRGAGHRTTPSATGLRHGLVVVQVAAAMSVLVATGLLLRSLDRLLRQDLGFDPTHLMTARLELSPVEYAADRNRDGFADEVLRRLAGTPGVESAAATTFLPFQGWPQYIMRLEDDADIRVSDAPTTGYQGVSPGYFRTLGMTMVRGRGFSPDDREDTPRVAVVNQTFSRRFFGDGDPIGKRFEVGFGDPPLWLRIVGVVSDAKGPSLEAQPREQVFVPLRQQAGPLRGNPALSLVVRGRGEPGQWTEAIRQAVWAVDRDQPVHRLEPMTRMVSAQTAQRRFTVTVLASFAGAAMVLAVVGLYGVTSGGVAARTRELGIRLALGSSREALSWLELRRGAALTAAGVVLGMLGSVGVTRWLRSLLFEVEPLDPVTFGVVPALLTVVALMACWLPCRRAGKVDPMVVLRAE